MSQFGKFLVIGIFVISVYGTVANFRDLSSPRRSGGKLIANLLAFAVWVFLFLVRNVFGWRPLLLTILTVVLASGLPVVAFTVLKHVSSTWATRLEAAVTYLTDADEDVVSNWAVTFFFALLNGAWLYFLLLAPFGVLCAFGVRSCGSLE